MAGCMNILRYVLAVWNTTLHFTSIYHRWLNSFLTFWYSSLLYDAQVWFPYLAVEDDNSVTEEDVSN